MRTAWHAPGKANLSTPVDLEHAALLPPVGMHGSLHVGQGNLLPGQGGQPLVQPWAVALDIDQVVGAACAQVGGVGGHGVQGIGGDERILELVVVELVEQGMEGTGLSAFAADRGAGHHGRVVVAGGVQDHRRGALAFPGAGSALGFAVGGVGGVAGRVVGPLDDGGGAVVTGAGHRAYAQGEQGGQGVAAPARVCGVVDGGQVFHQIGGGFACGGGGWG